MTRRALVSLTALCVLASCSWGMRVEHNPVSSTPAGIRVRYHVRGENLDRGGELFAADSLGLMVRGPRNLARVPWGSLQWLSSGLGGAYDVPNDAKIGREQQQRLALVSRFPQGLDGELLRRVLAKLRQDSLEQIR